MTFYTTRDLSIAYDDLSELEEVLAESGIEDYEVIKLVPAVEVER